MVSRTASKNDKRHDPGSRARRTRLEALQAESPDQAMRQGQEQHARVDHRIVHGDAADPVGTRVAPAGQE
jgi:hypothetical protein